MAEPAFRWLRLAALGQSVLLVRDAALRRP